MNNARESSNLPGDATEDQQEAVVKIETKIRVVHLANPVFLRADHVPYRRMVPCEGNAQPLGDSKERNVVHRSYGVLKDVRFLTFLL